MNFVSFKRSLSSINYLCFLSPVSWEAIGAEHSFLTSLVRALVYW